jgi:hypothetical protein
MDRPKRGDEGEVEVEVEEVDVDEAAAAGDAEMFVYSVVLVLRFGCMGGGRSVVGREGDGERD